MAAVLQPTPAPAPDIAELRTRFRTGKAALLDAFRNARASAPAATRLIHAVTRHVDRTLLALWQQAGMPADAALIAVGGYGRGELYPHSDVDVLVLLPPAGVAVARPGRASAKVRSKASSARAGISVWTSGRAFAPWTNASRRRKAT